ncbi:MAG: response regulator [Stigonema ocellatum SAG 48.90 = DSM 106950]|nr:response regulator [Stigonema ocellatum SAG 48.90 = DSM 106950]
MKRKATSTPSVNKISHGFPLHLISPANLTAIPELTLKTSNLFVWVSGYTVFTLNPDSVEEILIPEANQIVHSRDQRFLHWRKQMIPAYQVSELLSYTHPLLQVNSPQNQKPEPMLVLSLGQQILALQPEIESLITDTELVIQPFTVEMALPCYVYGCTIWKDRLLPVINVAALVTQPQSQMVRDPVRGSDALHADLLGEAPTSNKTTKATTTVKEPTVLVVDDSKTVRSIVSLTLQKAGFQVLLAQDGLEAIAQLRENPSIQLVICDLDMPYFNGFEFLCHRLKDPLLTKVPVVILSTCSSNKYRQLAMHLGATSYLTKPYVEQEFLAALKVIVEPRRD